MLYKRARKKHSPEQYEEAKGWLLGAKKYKKGLQNRKFIVFTQTGGGVCVCVCGVLRDTNKHPSALKLITFFNLDLVLFKIRSQ